HRRFILSECPYTREFQCLDIEGKRFVERLGQALLGGVAHGRGPDMEPTAPGRKCRSRPLPGSPDAFALVIALVVNRVPADVLFGPPALARLELVAALEDECADPVAALALDCALAER